jgi:hypothetical protein
MSNILLNKPATASDYYAPFTPAKAVDGVISPLSRWVSSKTGLTSPSWLQIDLQGAYCVNQYSLAFMGSANLWNNPQYNVKNFSVQGSMDGGAFFDLDNISGNSSPSISRYLPPTWVRYLRVFITSGLNCNSGVSSIVDFQAFEAANTPMLSNLVPSAGTLNPVFGSRTFNYSISVDNTVGTIAFTPTSLQSNMEIKVNGTVVASGSQSGQIALSIGNNSIPITVKSSDGSIITSYTIIVTRTGAASYLSGLSIIEENLELPVTLNPTFNSTTLIYTSTVNADYVSITVTPTTSDSTATIKVNNVVVASGQPSGSINLNVGSNTLTIQVITSGGTITTYSVVITKTA